jgi:hypothetical protein
VPMNFLYPAFLWALAALAIPIIIHLFNFRKTTRIFFSNNRFLKQIKEVTSAKRRLKHYLILASRLLFLFFLVIVFAQPIIPAREQLGADHSVVIYIDNSQSMSAQLADKTPGLQASLRFAQAIVSQFPADTKFKILTNDFAPFSNAFKSKPEATDLLAQIKFSSVSRTFNEIVTRMKSDLTRDRQVFWISDFQRSTLGALPQVWDSLSRWHFVPVKFASTSNVFVDSASLENPFASSGEKNVLNVILRNDGDHEVNDLNIRLAINGIQAGTTQLSIPAKGSTNASFDIASGLKGFNRAHISFADFPVSFDNEFFIALNFANKVKVIEIKPSSAATAVQQVFGNREIFDFKGYPVGNFTYSVLSDADLVVINGLNKIEPSLVLAVQQYMSDRGGSVLVIPGKSVDVESYKQLAALPSLRTTADMPIGDIDRPDFSNPFFENVFEEKSAAIAMPRATPYLNWGNDRAAILKFKSDVPFLSRFDRAQGKLFVLASPLESSFTDFHSHALFVPVMYRIAASSKKNDQRLYYSVKEKFLSVEADTLLDDRPVRLVGNQEIIPSQRRVNNQLFIDIPKFSIQQGFYKVVSEKDSLQLVAFNIDNTESLLAQFDGNEIKNQLGNGDNISIFEAESVDQFSSEVKDRYLGKPLWKHALLLSLLFLLAEVLLIRFLK